MKDNIDPKSHIKTDKWAEYKPVMKSPENMKRVKSGKKEANFNELNRWAMGFKGCLREIYHCFKQLASLYEWIQI